MPITSILISVLVLAFILYRQRQVREARQDVRWWLLGIMAAYGAFTWSQAIQGHSVTVGVDALLLTSMVVGAGMGVWRGMTVRLWRRDGRVLRQGTAKTIALWLVSIAIHVGLDFVIARTSAIPGLGESSILLYLAVTWGTQGLTVAHRTSVLRQENMIANRTSG